MKELNQNMSFSESPSYVASEEQAAYRTFNPNVSESVTDAGGSDDSSVSQSGDFIPLGSGNRYGDSRPDLDKNGIADEYESSNAGSIQSNPVMDSLGDLSTVLASFYTLLGTGGKFDLSTIIKTFGDLKTSIQHLGGTSEDEARDTALQLFSFMQSYAQNVLNQYWDRENWIFQQEYNSPYAQIQRLEAAGVNPAFFYGSLNSSSAGSIGGSTGSINSMSGGTTSQTDADKANAIFGGVTSLTDAINGFSERTKMNTESEYNVEMSRRQRRLTPLELAHWSASNCILQTDAAYQSSLKESELSVKGSETLLNNYRAYNEHMGQQTAAYQAIQHQQTVEQANMMIAQAMTSTYGNLNMEAMKANLDLCKSVAMSNADTYVSAFEDCIQELITSRKNGVLSNSIVDKALTKFCQTMNIDRDQLQACFGAGVGSSAGSGGSGASSANGIPLPVNVSVNAGGSTSSETQESNGSTSNYSTSQSWQKSKEKSVTDQTKSVNEELFAIVNGGLDAIFDQAKRGKIPVQTLSSYEATMLNALDFLGRQMNVEVSCKSANTFVKALGLDGFTPYQSWKEQNGLR